MLIPKTHLALCLPAHMPRQAKRRSHIGQSLVETLTGFMLLIPLGLVSYDLTYLLIANQTNERLADNAARVAANYADPADSKKAAQRAIDDFQQTANYGKVTLSTFDYNNLNNGEIVLVIQMDVTIPVALGSWHNMTINAQSVQPIVGVAAAR